MTDSPRYTTRNGSRGSEKPRRAETLDASTPPGEETETAARALPIGVDYIRRLKIGRLDSPRDYRRAMNKCIRAMARGTLPRELGTGLVWALGQAGNEARKELEERVFDQLARLEAEPRQGVYRPQLANDLNDKDLGDIARSGWPALEVLPADTDKEGL